MDFLKFYRIFDLKSGSEIKSNYVEEYLMKKTSLLGPNFFNVNRKVVDCSRVKSIHVFSDGDLGNLQKAIGSIWMVGRRNANNFKFSPYVNTNEILYILDIDVKLEVTMRCSNTKEKHYYRIPESCPLFRSNYYDIEPWMTDCLLNSDVTVKPITDIEPNPLYSNQWFFDAMTLFKNQELDDPLNIVGWWMHDLRLKQDYYLPYDGFDDFERLVECVFNHCSLRNNTGVWLVDCLHRKFSRKFDTLIDQDRILACTTILSAAPLNRIYCASTFRDSIQLSFTHKNDETPRLKRHILKLFERIVLIVMQIYPVNCGRHVSVSLVGRCESCSKVKVVNIGWDLMHYESECSSYYLSLGSLFLVCKDTVRYVSTFQDMMDVMIGILVHISLGRPFLHFNENQMMRNCAQDKNFKLNIPGVGFKIISNIKYNREYTLNLGFSRVVLTSSSCRTTPYLITVNQW